MGSIIAGYLSVSWQLHSCPPMFSFILQTTLSRLPGQLPSGWALPLGEFAFACFHCFASPLLMLVPSPMVAVLVGRQFLSAQLQGPLRAGVAIVAPTDQQPMQVALLHLILSSNYYVSHYFGMSCSNNFSATVW